MYMSQLESNILEQFPEVTGFTNDMLRMRQPNIEEETPNPTS